MSREAIIDIGSSKVFGTSWSIDRDGEFSIDAQSIVEYAGIKLGDQIDHDALRVAIYKCLDGVQDEMNLDVEQIVIGVPGAYCKAICCKSARIFKEKTLINDSIINKMSAESIADSSVGDHIKIHTLPFRYICDGEAFSVLPDNTEVTSLEIVFSHVFVENAFVETVEEAMFESQYKVRKYFSAPFAIAMTTIPEKERERGSILVDVGANFSDISVFQHGVPISIESIPIGGRHITNDISFVIECEANTAETIKRQYVFGLAYDESIESVRKSDGTIEEVPTKLIQDVIEARAGEIVEMINIQIENAEFEIGDKAIVYLTGGGLAMLRGGVEFVQKKVLFPVRATLSKMPRRNNYNIASGLAIADLESRNDLANSDRESKTWRDRPFFQKLLHFFTE